MSKERKRSVGVTIGSILVGFDQQIFRTLPPAHELVAKSKSVRGLSGQGPDFEVVFRDDVSADSGGTPAADIDAETDAQEDVGPGQSAT